MGNVMAVMEAYGFSWRDMSEADDTLVPSA